jgi:glutamyl-tRNA reductase
VAVLFTCNRIEVYATGDAGAEELLVSHFSSRCGMEAGLLRPHLYTARGQAAALHLMRVAAGLESMVLGESQILGQVADAIDRARHAGSAGPMLSRVFGAAVAAGKRARTDTDIGRHTLSISHAGVMLARAACPDLVSAHSLVIGAGDMARLAIAALRSYSVRNITVINRTPARAEILAGECGIRAVAWPELRQALAGADVVIAATSSAVPVIGARDLAAGGRPQVLIDLGVPRNIDRSVAAVAGVELHDVDDLRQVVEQHRILRQREVGRVEVILEEELDRCLEHLRSQHLAPVIAGLRQKVDEVVAAELERALRRLPAADEGTKALLDLMAHRIVTKLLHEPTIALRSPSGPRVAQAICEAFGLDPHASDATSPGKDADHE